MGMGRGLRCYVIGSDSLLIECCEILLKTKHELLGIITDTDRLAAWARNKRIPVLGAQSDYGSILAERSFDYLFSITYLSLIPDEILALPQMGAINFHDGPLPRYAGLNAPVWALLNQETDYGITWHQITAGVDEGDVLLQRWFAIDAAETALTLNTKCFEQGIESFSELIEQLAGGHVPTQVQDLEQRSYFGRDKRPPAACLLDWTQTAESLETLVRALDFGPYPNPLGRPKLFHGGRAFSVKRAQTREVTSVRPPGTLLALEDDALLVATATQALAVSELTTLEGQKISLKEVLSHLNLEIGGALDLLDDRHKQRLTELNIQLCKRETFWLKRLHQLDPIELPHAGGSPDLERFLWESTDLAVPEPFYRRFEPAGEALTAAFSLYLSRVGGKRNFSMGYADAALQERLDGLEAFVADQVPLRVAIDPLLPFGAFLQAFEKELKRVRRRLSWIRDLPDRFPELQGKPELTLGHHQPVAVAICDAEHQRGFRPGNLLLLSMRVDGRGCELVYRPDRYSAVTAARIGSQFVRLLESIAVQEALPVGDLPILSDEERRTLLLVWNETETEFRPDAKVHQLFEEQVLRTPTRTALIFEGASLTYKDLNRRANQLAHYLLSLGVGLDRMVGVCIDRSLELLTAVLAVQKAGGAYVPLDPAFPRERIAMMVEDSAAAVIITGETCRPLLEGGAARLVFLERETPRLQRCSPENPHVPLTSAHLAYVIYTSGSTGRPKGVMVHHQGVINFFKGMDACVAHEKGGTWLAVTSLSFDISVLELFWTLTHGFRIVIYLDRDRADDIPASISAKPMDYSLFYFSSDENADAGNKYRLLMEGARFADQNGFVAVWTPERHFHEFGGLYPNPAITGAAVAAITEHVQIRAGSVVLPLNHPIRIAEGWSVVDNISRGRVGISVAAGWQPNDFILRPENYKNPKQAMFRDLETVQRLWRGETVDFPGATGKPVSVKTLPRPVQKALPVWVTSAGNIETYRMAGSIGANLLTHLLGQSIEKLAPKIQAYREARTQHGFVAGEGIVSLMLHSFVADDGEMVREVVREPLKQYLGSSLNLLKQYAWSFPAFTRPGGVDAETDGGFENLSEEEQDAMLEHAFERYYESSGLFGDPEGCLDMVNRLKAIGVDDIACLIDFGVPTDLVLENLPRLDQLRKMSNPDPDSLAAAAAEDFSLAAQLRKYAVTHLQCTPSMARLMTVHDETREAMDGIEHFFIGGEAFPSDLADALQRVGQASITNMYGPTETTIWSSTQVVEPDAVSIPIGRPIANTRLYILDDRLVPVPAGVPGELFIGGTGVVRGYLRRPDLTATRFIPDPFHRDLGRRIYRTGDLARFDSKGVVVFLGRIDHQVKIRGYRIELGEIEAQLLLHPSVSETVVIAREDEPGDQRLVGYLVAGPAHPQEDQLREFLGTALPQYMVPAHIITLEKWPLTPNGKIDRKALPSPNAGAVRSKSAYVAPADEVQKTIVAVWQETLGRDQVGIDDNFFDIGGHSLLVVRMHRNLRDAIDKPIQLTDLYRFTTIRKFSEFLAGGGKSEGLKKGLDRAQKRRRARGRRR